MQTTGRPAAAIRSCSQAVSEHASKPIRAIAKPSRAKKPIRASRSLATFASNMAMFSKLSFGQSKDGLLSLDDAKGNDAAQKLSSLGFSPVNYRDALETYAVGLDIPGIGPDARTAATVAPSEQPAASPATMAQTVASTATAGTTPAPAVAPVAARIIDPGNAKAAASMLQAALDQGNSATGNGALSGLPEGTPNRNTTEDAALSALVQSLKAGSDPNKSDTAPAA